MSALFVKSLSKAQRVGLFDSGLGGLTVLSSLLSKPDLKEKEFLYLGDTNRCPYGSRPYEEIKLFVNQLAEWLVQEGADAIVMACNTSAALVGVEMKVVSPVPVYNLLDITAEYIKAIGFERVGIISTETTARTKAFSKAIAKAKSPASVIEFGCPELVPVVENGLANSKKAEEALMPYVRELVRQDVEAIVFGCTHYPFLRAALNRTIRKLTDKTIVAIDPSEILASELSVYKNGFNHPFDLSGLKVSLATTGNAARFAEKAAILLNQDASKMNVRAVRLETEVAEEKAPAVGTISPAPIP